jgi:hypothetical protein
MLVVIRAGSEVQATRPSDCARALAALVPAGP